MNHPDFLKILVDEKLNDLRSEGLRSQELHRSGIRTSGPANLSKQIPIFFARRDVGALTGRAARLSRFLLSILGIG